MAEGDGSIYNNAKELLLLGDLSLDSDTLKIALLDNGYTPNIDTDVYWDDINANEVSGTGYTAGGVTLSGKTVTQDNANDRAVFDAADAVWAGLDIGTPAWAVLYKDTGNPATSPLIAYWQLGTTATTGGDYTLQFNASGILTLS